MAAHPYTPVLVKVSQRLGILILFGRSGCQMVKAFWKQCSSFFKSRTFLWCHWNLLFLFQVFNQEKRKQSHKKICTQMWGAALFAALKKNNKKQNWGEKLRMSTGWWTDKQRVFCPYNGKLLCNKKEGNICQGWWHKPFHFKKSWGRGSQRSVSESPVVYIVVLQDQPELQVRRYLKKGSEGGRGSEGEETLIYTKTRKSFNINIQREARPEKTAWFQSYETLENAN